MSAYDIREAVRDALTRGYSADPNLIADKVAAEVPAKALRDALAAVLPTFVSTTLSLYRREVLAAERDGEPSETGSSRWSAASKLLAPVRGIEGYQFLKDCTRDDVLAMVEERRSRASRLTAMADRYQHLADLMGKRNARVVADLPDTDLSAVFG